MAPKKGKRKRAAAPAPETDEVEVIPDSQPLDPMQEEAVLQEEFVGPQTSAQTSDGDSDKKKKLIAYQFDEEQEKELSIWYRENHLFYNKKLKSYKYIEKKKQLYKDKARTYDPECSGK